MSLPSAGAWPVNMSNYERAMLAEYAYKQGKHTGSLEVMRAICYVLRNRVKAGWGASSWFSVLDQAGAAQAHDMWLEQKQQNGSGSDRLLAMILRDVDDIYLQQDRHDDATRQIVVGDDPPKSCSLYFGFVDRPCNVWFKGSIVDNHKDHPLVGNIGPLMLYK